MDKTNATREQRLLTRTLQYLSDSPDLVQHGADALAAEIRDVLAAPLIDLATSRHRRIYIAGPMTGLPDWNYPAFNAQALELRERGYHVENPAEHGRVEHAEWADYLRYDIGRLATCESIFLLPGWEKSNGARLEVYIASALGMTFIHHPDAQYVTEVEAKDLEILEAAYIKAGEREHELRLLLVERNEQIAALTAVQESATEGAAILRSLIESIEAKGNYSPESTVNFLNQALGCLQPAFAAPAPAEQKAEPVQRPAVSPSFPDDSRYTYCTTQATHCAECGKHKHTPLRVDWMGGYVCLTCIDKKLDEQYDQLNPDDDAPHADTQKADPVCKGCDGRGQVCVDWEAGAWSDCHVCKAAHPADVLPVPRELLGRVLDPETGDDWSVACRELRALLAARQDGVQANAAFAPVGIDSEGGSHD